MWHSKHMKIQVFFIAWTEFVCFIKLYFLVKVALQMPQLNNFFLSWTESTCSVKDFFWVKVVLQMSQSNSFFPSCTEAVWVFKLLFRVKAELQISHLNGFLLSCGFFPSWTDATCLFKELFRVNVALQILHLTGFFLSWTETISTFKSKSVVKSWAGVDFSSILRWQNQIVLIWNQIHLYDFIFVILFLNDYQIVRCFLFSVVCQQPSCWRIN